MKTIPHLIHEQVKRRPNEAALFYRENGVWVGKSWALYWDEALRLAQVLTDSGIKKGDVFAITAPSSINWEMMHTAALLCGAVVVGIDPHATNQQILQMLEHAGAKGLFATNETRIKDMGHALPAIGVRFVLTLAEIEGRIKMAGRFDWESAGVTADDYATLIYSSGTTGQSKAIRYRHSQILAACDDISEAFPISQAKTICWLPLSNLFQRMVNLIAIKTGSVIYFVENPMEIMTAVGEVEPTVLIGVPRFYEKVYQGIQEKLKALPAWLKPVALKIVRRKVLGRNMKFMVTGSAPILSHVQSFFNQMGVPLLDAYGTSENVIPMAMNRPDDARPLTVGKPLKSNLIRISPEGEIEVKGPGVFEGYYNSESPRDRFTDDGYYKTGDHGRFDKDGYLILKGRRSEVIVTSTGRKISPVDIEALFRQIPGVENVLVTGSGRKCLVGLLKISPKEQVDFSQVRQKIAALNKELQAHEQVRTWGVLREGFSIESGELTLNLKLRRGVIEKNHQAMIEELYQKLDEREIVLAPGF